MGKNEENTHREIAGYISSFEKDCEIYKGKILDVRGDGIFAVFESVVEAVNCAVAFQDRIANKNEFVSEASRIQFRIGVHLGDVLADGDYYFGDSVNIAARLESLANPGGICISRTVYEQIKNKLEYGYEYLGPKQLKNVIDTVDVFLVHREIQEGIMAPSLRVHASEVPADQKDYAQKSSLVVMPFENISGDSSEDYFCDGISEDIITNLSKFHNLFVISRGSAFTYKGKNVPVKQIGKELGVRYVAEGSIRKAGNKMRISAHLIDASSGQTLWGQNYDRQLDDVFAIQDEISEYIVGATAVQIEAAEVESMRQNPPTDLKAYSLVLQGQRLVSRYTRQDNCEARLLFEAARQTDPHYARAAAGISRTLNIDWRYSWSDSPDEALDQALKYARESVALDNTDARGYSELGFVYLYSKEHDLAINAYKQALMLNPNDADIMADMGDALDHSGKPEEAIKLLSKAMLLNPFYPDQYLWSLGGAYYSLRRYDEAIETLLRMNNPAEGRRLLAASFAQLGRQKEAQEHAAKVLLAHPDFSLANWARVLPDRYPEDTEHFIEGLRKAGLPE